MGRSPTISCFKFMTCSGDVAGGDNPASVESKASLDKGRWSFRKRSSKHSVISEPGFNTNIPETMTNNSHSGKESPLPESPPMLEEINEKPPLSAAVNSEVADTVQLSVPQSPSRLEQTNKTSPLPAVIVPEVSDVLLPAEVTTTIDNNFREDVVIVIQAAIRGYLAQKELEKRKNVVKLQAAVRGHLVRRQAVGTLRCVQAIIKMQALVRARRAHQPENFAAEEKLDEKIQFNSGMKSDTAYTSTEKLLSNAFARLLLESMPKTKPIHVSCDPLRSDSAWKWLERWMVVMSSELGQQQERDDQGEKEKINFAASEVVNIVPHTVTFIASDSKSSPSIAIVGEGDSIKKDTAEYEVHGSVSISNQSDSSVAKGDQEQSQYESKTSGLIEENNESAASIEGEADIIYENSAEYQINVPVSVPNQEISSVAKNDQEQSQCESETSGMIEENMRSGGVEETFDSTTSQAPAQSDATSQSLLDNNSTNSGFDMENQKCIIERATCEPLETQGKKCALRSRKELSPAFAAVQSKFEELSSASGASRSVTYVNRGAGVQSKLIHTQVDSPTKTEGHSMIQYSRSHGQVENSASECGTEISASSTFDLPEGSGVDDKGTALKVGVLQNGNCNLTDDADSALSNENMNSDTKFSHSESDVLQPQKLKESEENLFSAAAAVDSKQENQLPAESTTSSIQIQVENMKDAQICSLSPEGSPRSHVTAPESHRTPSSQISAKSKTSKAENNIHAQKQRSQLARKNSPSIPKNDSGARKSTEHLPKDAKNAKRHISFGMAKPDHDDYEPGDSSSNTLPRYMQATESARAKVHDIISLKASTNVHDNDDHMKKRHSLPIGDVKQDSSPHMQKSTPQAQQNLKRNNTHSPQNSAAC
ncbi:protein IQ-DOMAIN 32 isoform X2 [Elaeis guineensis]|uniref:Protein IQ-DOMAIN 32 isoform X2 n=1 Tax=Elaeis guineensis var. tenera TaxID=51953 RepID=A0A6I9RYX6_ELAGV|nr:protein IQ-DOMAIN 32 isoform X2 [Elaeis guineensis]